MDVVAGLIFEKSGCVLLARKPNTKTKNKDVWEFPGGKVEPGETPEQALTRELREELTIHIQDTHFCTNLWSPDKRWRLLFYLTRTEDPILPTEHPAFTWLPLDQALNLPLSPTDREFLKAHGQSLPKLLKKMR